MGRGQLRCPNGGATDGEPRTASGGACDDDARGEAAAVALGEAALSRVLLEHEEERLRSGQRLDELRRTGRQRT